MKHPVSFAFHLLRASACGLQRHTKQHPNFTKRIHGHIYSCQFDDTHRYIVAEQHPAHAFAGAEVMLEGVFIEIFSKLKDPRVERTKKHLFLDVIGLSLFAILVGAQCFTEMEQFCKLHRE